MDETNDVDGLTEEQLKLIKKFAKSLKTRGGKRVDWRSIVITVFVPLIISLAVSIYTTRYMIEKELTIGYKLPKLVEFSEFVDKLGPITYGEARRIVQGDGKNAIAAGVLARLTQDANKLRFQYARYKAYLSRKYREKADDDTKKWSKEIDPLIDAIVFEPEKLDSLKTKEPEKVRKLVTGADNYIKGIKEVVSQNIAEILNSE